MISLSSFQVTTISIVVIHHAKWWPEVVKLLLFTKYRRNHHHHQPKYYFVVRSLSVLNTYIPTAICTKSTHDSHHHHHYNIALSFLNLQPNAFPSKKSHCLLELRSTTLHKVKVSLVLVIISYSLHNSHTQRWNPKYLTREHPSESDFMISKKLSAKETLPWSNWQDIVWLRLR